MIAGGNRKSGFSLAEIVVAIGIIAFALVAVIGVIPVGLTSGRTAAKDTRANHLAEQIFSTLAAQPFKNASLATLGSSSAPIDLSAADTPSGEAGIMLHATYDGQFVGANDYFTI
ncbi:MAG TPA: prepilin-type N-terminal cleavage/methylation domain-containing protein, partial [Chthoniobacterales bacterium]|nr:prepilin-type N-terminal cleavage/methylation domain-containing protein [Chthoniobacterales bacterium]